MANSVGFPVVDFLPSRDRHAPRITPQFEGRSRARPFTRRVRTSAGGLASGTEGPDPGRDRLFPRRLPVELRHAGQLLTEPGARHIVAVTHSARIVYGDLSEAMLDQACPQSAPDQRPHPSLSKQSERCLSGGENATPGRKRANGQRTLTSTASRQAAPRLRSADRAMRAA
jgi:hypothetical protein